MGKLAITNVKLIFMLLFVTLGLQASAQDTEENLGIVFKIQLSASGKPLPRDHKLYMDFPELEEIHFDDGYYRYYVGGFEGYFAAKEYLTDVVKPKGYESAYVMALRGKERMTADQAIDIIYGDE